MVCLVLLFLNLGNEPNQLNLAVKKGYMEVLYYDNDNERKEAA